MKSIKIGLAAAKLITHNRESIARIANRCAREYGTTWATEILACDDVLEPTVVYYDGYHAESRTGIRASMAALKRFWSTYHYVAMECQVAIPLSWIQNERTTLEEF